MIFTKEKKIWHNREFMYAGNNLHCGQAGFYDPDTGELLDVGEARGRGYSNVVALYSSVRNNTKYKSVFLLYIQYPSERCQVTDTFSNANALPESLKGEALAVAQNFLAG